MVRTKADASHTKAAGAKAPRKNLSVPSNSSNFSSGGDKGKDNSGKNSYCPRETPEWQKPITSFFNQGQQTKTNSDSAEQSSSKDPIAGNSTSEEDVAS